MTDWLVLHLQSAEPGLEPGLLHGLLLFVVEVTEEALELAEAIVVQNLKLEA